MRDSVLVVIILAGCGGGDPAPVSISGAAQKGPFVLGSSVDVAPVDVAGNPSGQVFGTQTTSDLGEFSLDVTPGLVRLEGEGFYYNEVTGALSGAPITLRAFAEVTTAGSQAIYVNLITHLTHERVRSLVEVGTALLAATEQAEAELRVALGVGPVGFDPGGLGVDMNILGGDQPRNAYLFAVSAIIAQASGGQDAALQELVNQLGTDLAGDGTLEIARRATIDAGHRSLDGDAVTAAVAARLVELGSTATIPDIHTMLDTDADGVMNVDDNCRAVANLAQADTDGDGVGDACEVSGCVGALTCTPDGGGGCFIPPSQEAMLVGGGIPDWSCMAVAAGTVAGVTQIGGTVRDAQTLQPVGATVALHVTPDASALAETTADGAGAWTTSIPSGSSTDLHARASASGYLDTWVQHLALDPVASPQTRDLVAWSDGLAAALPALVGVSRTPGTALLDGTIRDCNDQPVRNAIATLTTASGTMAGCPSFVGGAQVFYFDADSDLPVRRTLLSASDDDGRFALIEIPPGGSVTPQYLQIWAYPTTAHLAMGEAGFTLIAEVPVWTLADSVTVIDLPANRGPL